VQKELGANQWEYKNFENFEDAMPALRKIHQGKQQCIVTIDEQMASSGGVMTGLNGTCWLINDLKFQGIIISSSGDVDIGDEHIKLGAHLNWGKPLPSLQQMISDLSLIFNRHSSSTED